MTASPPSSRTFFDLSAYQWTVLFAAWLGWGFDIFDGILFNFVAPNCIPTLLGIAQGWSGSQVFAPTCSTNSATYAEVREIRSAFSKAQEQFTAPVAS